MMLHRMQDRGERIERDAAPGRADAARRAVAQRRRRDRRPRAAGRGRRDGRAHRLVGRGHRARWTTAAASSPRGRRCACIKRLGLKPKRTIRVVGWVNEENGLRGGLGVPRGARARAREARVRHGVRQRRVPALRHAPRRHRRGDRDARADRRAARAASARARRRAARARRTSGRCSTAGVPGAGLDVDGTRYFWFHHTDADTPDKLDPREVAQCVATFGVWAFVVADMPARPAQGVAPAASR